MKASITIVLVALVVVAMAITCAAGELTGASTCGARWDTGEWVLSNGTTLDYELASGLFVTFDSRTDYSRRSQPSNRIELSINYYPTFWILEGWCVSAGGLYRARSAPMYFIEISRPIEWPPGWLKTIWGWIR